MSTFNARGGQSYALRFVWLAILFLGIYASEAGAQEREAIPLQSLIDAAQEGDTIKLEDGMRYSGPAVILKRVTIRSTGSATIENLPGGPAITLDADGITLQGLRINDGQTDPNASAILVQSSFNRIENVTIVSQAGGIYLRGANDNSIVNCRIEGAKANDPKEAYSKRGNGIDLLASSRNTIENNTIVHVHDGVYAESSNQTRVVRNHAVDSRYGFHFMFSALPELIDNTGSRNVTGGMVMGVEGAVVSGNRFDKQTENVNSQGLLLFDVKRSEIRGNSVAGNRVGIYVERSSMNVFTNNEASNNFIGMQMIRSDGNRFTGGTFIANVIQAQATEGEDNEFEQNYWDDFQGLDVDGDGFSDIVYEIDPFFLKVTDQVEAYQLFFHSPGLPFLSYMFREDTSNWLKDIKPLMSQPLGESEPVSRERAVFLSISAILLLFSSMIIYRWGYKR